MDIEILTTAIGWASLLNMGVLLIWWLALTFAKKWMFNMHRRWFSLTDTQLNELHYLLYGQYKLATILLFITPYLALRIVS